MVEYTPRVKEAHAFQEISRDFTKPAEIFREAIANSLDAYAKRIWLRATVEVRKGKEMVIIDINDDGIGLNASSVQSFLNLSDSTKPPPPDGIATRMMTGYKGHGTKIYYNSERLEIAGYDGKSSPIRCVLRDPHGELAEGQMPKAEIEQISLEELKKLRGQIGSSDLALSPGTSIRVIGYHQNSKAGLEHDQLRDFVQWFTRWGSWEPKLRMVSGTTSREVEDFGSCSLKLQGLGRESEEQIPFGHVFPSSDCTDMRLLRTRDEVDPLRYYVRTWAFPDRPLLKNPDKRVDFLFAIEGEYARREYNEMLRRQGRPRKAGDYLSEERYGLWLGCDYVPIQRFNSWVSEHSEYTRMHAFVNSQDLDLTANRGSVENTSHDLLEDIERTIKQLFQEEVERSDDYSRFEDELMAVERHRHANREANDYKRRLKRLESKEVARIENVEFYSPKSEADLISLVSGVHAVVPNLLPFVIRDYDSHFGFDGLATRNKTLAINETKHLFVEFKYELKTIFSHTFDKLEAIICWITRVKDGETVTDLSGRRGTYRVTADSDKSKGRFIMVEGSHRNVEVISFKELLEHNGYRFRPIGG